MDLFLHQKRWIGTTNAVGIVSKAEDMLQRMLTEILRLNLLHGYHRSLKLYIIEEYQRLKNAEKQPSLIKTGNLNRRTAKTELQVQYRGY